MTGWQGAGSGERGAGIAARRFEWVSLVITLSLLPAPCSLEGAAGEGCRGKALYE